MYINFFIGNFGIDSPIINGYENSTQKNLNFKGMNAYIKEKNNSREQVIVYTSVQQPKK